MTQKMMIKTSYLSFSFNYKMTQKVENLKQIAAKYKNYFFDLDGVIWKGSKKIEGGVQALNFLRDSNKNIFFITNSSIRNRQMVKDRFVQFGFQAQYQQIYPSDYITRLYINSKYPDVKKWLVVGAPSLYEEIKLTQKKVVFINDLNLQNGVNVEGLKDKIDQEIDGIVFGYDSHITHVKILLVTMYVQRKAIFVATNPDKYTMIDNYRAPGCGSLISPIEIATQIKADVAGKPNPFIIQHIIKEKNLNKSECLMIGDNLETDISFGNNAGIDSLCVLTGVSTEEMVQKSNVATYYADRLL